MITVSWITVSCRMNPSGSLLLEQIRRELSNLRLQLNFSYHEVYTARGIDVEKLERDDGDMDVTLLSAICDYYRVSLSDFFTAVES